ncbi:MAG TPA: hypothetical protein ENJ97_02825, partial [Planctomycetes bacterium]|nr:hypothetical protein [Planctomycetota bacterium]
MRSPESRSFMEGAPCFFEGGFFCEVPFSLKYLPRPGRAQRGGEWKAVEMKRFASLWRGFRGGAFRAGLLLGLVFSSCAGPGREGPSYPGTEVLESRLSELLSRPGFTTAHLGVFVKDLSTGRVMCDHQGGRAFLPASNMKLFTGALALDRLGPAWQAATLLYGKGEIKSGVLEGDLVLVGGGDPTLGRGPDPLGVFRKWGKTLFGRG